jgi:hypothetical protein
VVTVTTVTATTVTKIYVKDGKVKSQNSSKMRIEPIIYSEAYYADAKKMDFFSCFIWNEFRALGSTRIV